MLTFLNLKIFFYSAVEEALPHLDNPRLLSEVSESQLTKWKKFTGKTIQNTMLLEGVPSIKKKKLV
jgi:hypothetical protein